MSRWAMMVVAVALLDGGCRKKPALLRTPVTQLDPFGSSTPAPRPLAEAEDDSDPRQPLLRPADGPDAGARNKVMVAPKTSTAPSVASPYIPGGGSEHLPMWRQRAKFY